MNYPILLLILTGSLLTAVETGPAVAMLADLRAANVARAALASELAAWHAEEDRLRAVLAAVQMETVVYQRRQDQAGIRVQAASAELAGLRDASELEAIQAGLAEAGTRIRSALEGYDQTLLPGVISLPQTTTGLSVFDDAMLALTASEKAASSLAIEIVPGQADDRTLVIKLLRLAGAAAWWVTLDDTQAGTATVDQGKLRLHPATDERARAAIILALAMVEGRKAAELVLLPLPAMPTP